MQKNSVTNLRTGLQTLSEGSDQIFSKNRETGDSGIRKEEFHSNRQQFGKRVPLIFNPGMGMIKNPEIKKSPEDPRDNFV